MLPDTTTNNLFRLDKNVAHNIRDFRAFDEDKQLIKALITYFSYSLQNDLFGYGILDPHEFSRKMGFTPNYLRSKHPNPACFKEMTPSEIEETYRTQERYPEHREYRVFDSIFENALYLLRYNRVKYTSSGVSFKQEGNEYVKISLDEIQFLSELSIVFKKTKSGTKIFYTYRLTDSFINNISNYYLKSKIDSLKILRQPGLDELYLYLKNLMTTFALQGKCSDMSSFDLLCELAYINSKDASDRKTRLNNAFKILNEKTEIKVKLNWLRTGKSKFAYIPEVEFDREQLTLLTDNDSINKERKSIFFTNLHYELSQGYRREVFVNDLGQAIDQNEFLKWIKGKKSGAIELSACFDMAIIKSFKKSNDWNFKAKNKFFENIKTATCLNEVFANII